MTKLEHAAIQYLKALESDEPDEHVAEAAVSKAVEDMKSAGILWAQGYIIQQAEEAHNRKQKD